MLGKDTKVDYEPSSLSVSLHSANRQLLSARARIALGQELEANALLRIKTLESKPEFQGTEDREYVSRRLKTHAADTKKSIAISKTAIRKFKKQMKEIK